MKEADIGVSIEIEFLECVLTYGQVGKMSSKLFASL